MYGEIVRCGIGAGCGIYALKWKKRAAGATVRSEGQMTGGGGGVMSVANGVVVEWQWGCDMGTCGLHNVEGE